MVLWGWYIQQNWTLRRFQESSEKRSIPMLWENWVWEKCNVEQSKPHLWPCQLHNRSCGDQMWKLLSLFPDRSIFIPFSGPFSRGAAYQQCSAGEGERRENNSHIIEARFQLAPTVADPRRWISTGVTSMQVFNDPDSGFVGAQCNDPGESNWINTISEHVKGSNARPSQSLIGKVQFDILFSFMASFQQILDD